MPNSKKLETFQTIKGYTLAFYSCDVLILRSKFMGNSQYDNLSKKND